MEILLNQFQHLFRTILHFATQSPILISTQLTDNSVNHGRTEDIVFLESGTLFFQTCNAIMREKETDAPSIGIENCRKRLRLLYPERFTLLTEKNESKREFRTKLTIQLA